MDLKKSDHFEPAPAKGETPLPTVNIHVTESEPKASKFWTPLYVVGVFGCVFLLFHLYVTTAFHHAAMDRGLHKLEEEVHAMMESHRAQTNVTTNGALVPVFQSGRGRNGMLNSHVLPHERRQWGAKHSRRRSDVAPVKRGSGATFTWFKPGLGACGQYDGDNDHIVAISHLIWDNGAHCGEKITITYKGKTFQATVADRCTGCDPNHIDMSPGLLREVVGPGIDQVTDGVWWFGSAPAPEKPKPKPTTSSTPPPPPPPPTTTSKARPSTTSTRASSTTSSAAKTSSTASSTSTSAPASPTLGYVDDGKVHNLEDFNVLLINLGGLVTSAVNAKA